MTGNVQPYEAKLAPTPQGAGFATAIHDLMVAVNGFVYLGSDNEALIRAVSWLRTRPDMVERLGLLP